MHVSIQIPTYNQEDCVSKAIESALAQDYPDLEIVILDDGSTDRTFESAKAYSSDSRVKVFRNDVNLGRTRNYRRLLYELVTGEWVVNLDGDDFFIKNDFISKAVRKIKMDSDLVFYQAAIIGKTATTEYRFSHKLLRGRSEGSMDGREYFKLFFSNQFFGHLSTLFNVQKARDVGFYESNNLNADAESMLKLALHGAVYLDNSVVGSWNVHSSNESKTALRKNEELVASFARLKAYCQPYVGKDNAEKWYLDAIRSNTQSQMTLRAQSNFRDFLVEAARTRYFNSHLLRLIAKKVAGRL